MSSKGFPTSFCRLFASLLWLCWHMGPIAFPLIDELYTGYLAIQILIHQNNAIHKLQFLRLNYFYYHHFIYDLVKVFKSERIDLHPLLLIPGWDTEWEPFHLLNCHTNCTLSHGCHIPWTSLYWFNKLFYVKHTIIIISNITWSTSITNPHILGKCVEWITFHSACNSCFSSWWQ